ncbi:PREDICTED: uncharacterized protein LOC104728289 [Camelina sativa]|uniref:Uncharacterized protein LOC104728289 n=1 Tax=Camelina sativa TaxID=90675 RepID=A0ABM0USK7_CAMSA|nr:PREDICTED: uncharacterized protein LOC104728289 [Camelina sativa]
MPSHDRPRASQLARRLSTTVQLAKLSRANASWTLAGRADTSWPSCPQLLSISLKQTAAPFGSRDAGVTVHQVKGSIRHDEGDLGQAPEQDDELLDEHISGDDHDTGPKTDWRIPIREYILNGTVPADRWQARKLKAQSARFCIIGEELYKRCIAGPYLRCVHGEETESIMEEAHEGPYGNHSGGRSLALRIKQQGYFWPTMLADCDAHGKSWDKCQRHAPMTNQPAELRKSVSSPYLFMRWSMDAISSLEQSGRRRVKHLLVVTDYFTKWIEAESYQSITRDHVKDFLWKNVVCFHCIPYEIVTDNGTNLISSVVQKFCDDWGIPLTPYTPWYPQGNGQAEAANKLIMDGLKRRLGAAKSGSDAQRPGVLWATRTTPHGSTGEIAFSQAYGIEAVVPAEISVGSIR